MVKAVIILEELSLPYNITWISYVDIKSEPFTEQGPMFGQKMWFTHFHPVKDITSVVERYANETKRIVGVVEAHLVKQQKEGTGDDRSVWLVGDKCTYADLAFVNWDMLLLSRLFPEGFDAKVEFPLFCNWHEIVIDHRAVRKVLDMREHCIAKMEDTARAVLPNRKA